MKKFFFVLLICFISFPCIYADNSVKSWSDRSFEIGIMQTDIGFSNNLFGILDIFQDSLEIDLNKLQDGFFLNLNLGVTPLYISFNSKKNWGFGFYLGADASGLAGLSGKMLNFMDANNEKSDLTLSVFAHAQFSLFFHISKLKMTLSPTVFYPAVYAVPSITYTKMNTDEETTLKLAYDLQVFSAISLADDNYREITGSPGFDFSLGLEFPLAEAIGLKKIIPFLDFSVGFDLQNFAMIPATLQSRMRMTGQIYCDKIDFINDGLNGFKIELENPIVYDESPLTVKRPFKLTAWAQWRPFKFLSVTPSIGFSLNGIYINMFSLEGGLKADINIFSIMNITAGAGYYDRVWVNSVDLALNFRVIEINIGINLRSNDFSESWNFLSGSPGARIGLKIGF